MLQKEKQGGGVADIEKLEKRLKKLEAELIEQKRTNKLLKKRALQAIVGHQKAQLCEVDRRECEAGLVQAELSSRVKSVFLENVSHEIRSSMSGIIGMTDLVLETELSAEQRLYLEMVGSSVDRLLVVVNEVLDVSKIETGEIEFEAEDFNLKQSLDHDLYVMSRAARDKGVELTCTVASDVPTHVNGDEVRLIQIVTNIVNNGIKFTDAGSVSVAIENDGYDPLGNLKLKFVVEDTGCGIVPEKVEQINHHFRQAITSHIPLPLSIGTTGLGLTVASQLVKLMGGEIGVESDANGTRFWFVLPYNEVADFTALEERTTETVANIQEEATYALRGAKVLLAEDEYINRVLIEAVLNQLGVEVFSVAGGKEAIAEACSGKHDLVLMDVQMEDVDGLEATRCIRAHEKKHGGHIPIVALTAHVMAGDREKCLQAGMDGYLTKPLVRKDILAVLTEYLTSRALVVVSDVDSQNVFVRGLVESGWQVTIAETKRSAMYEASLTHFDLIILDISSSEIEGLEAVKTIRRLERYTGQRAKIISLGVEGEQAGGAENDFDGAIILPATREKLLPHLGA